MATTWHIQETVKMEEGQKKGTVNGHERRKWIFPGKCFISRRGMQQPEKSRRGRLQENHRLACQRQRRQAGSVRTFFTSY